MIRRVRKKSIVLDHLLQPWRNEERISENKKSECIITEKSDDRTWLTTLIKLTFHYYYERDTSTVRVNDKL